MRVAIIGAGAAGCFCAINLKRLLPSCEVEVFEAGSRALAKVAVTGGGRCNLTNTFEGIRSLKEAYPRGEQVVKRAFHLHDHHATMQWFEKAGVRLVTQPDECVFPASQDAMQIVHTLLYNMERLGILLHLSHRITDISELRGRFDAVVVTTGGSPKVSGLSFLDALRLDIIPPIPSLFSFNITLPELNGLMGTVVETAVTRLAGTKFQAQGPLLITHWGMSGPAILKLSSYAARHLCECGYQAQLLVNWLGNTSEEEAHSLVQDYMVQHGARQVQNVHPSPFTSRLWSYLLQRSGLRPDQRWAEVGRKQANRLVSVLTADTYAIQGQSRHKDEFVTCGGVALSNVNLTTLECRNHPGIYLAGEVLDIDAITGGFNLQAAWSTGFAVAKAIEEKEKMQSRDNYAY